MPDVTVIIPAYNEAPRLAQVLNAVQRATLVEGIIVVDDGSADATSEVARAHGVRVIRHAKNTGKGSAMRTGALAAQSELLLFLDADLRHLQPAQVDALITPVAGGQAAMSVGTFRGGKAATDFAQRISPNLSGQRCLHRDFFLSAPLVEGSRFGVEIALTIHARACNLTRKLVILVGVDHPVREEKLGLWHGVMSRIRMYAEILFTYLRYHLNTHNYVQGDLKQGDIVNIKTES